MKTKYNTLKLLLINLVGLGAAVSAPLPFAEQKLQGDPTVRIRVVNSVTGRSVDGALMELREEVGNGPGLSRRLASGERLDVVTGVYDMRLQADGFLSVATRVTAGPGVRNIEINIDPLEVPRQLSPEYVRSLRRRDATVVVGCVVDEETRLPLAGVRVTSVRDGESVRTDQDGFYAIFVRVTGDSSLRRQPPAILFERDGYQAHLRNHLEVWPNGDISYRIKLELGSGVEVIDERKNRRRDGELEKMSPDSCSTCGDAGSQQPHSPAPTDPISFPTSPSRTATVTNVIPSMIRVGRSCSTSTTCTTVEYYSLETYVKHVIYGEVYSCWGTLQGGMNSLQAFAVPARSYGLWYVYHPISIYYDICSSTSCQVFGSGTTSNGEAAANATASYILTGVNGAVVRSEYSAENNNVATNGCGDGYAGTTLTLCIADPVCTGQTGFGHGRGLCQYGSVRWATGTIVTSGSPCALGTSHGYGTKDWRQIISHYYPAYQLGQAISVSIYHARFSPTTPADPGTKIYVVDSVQSSGTTNLLLGAAIAPTGTTNWAWDDSNDVSVDLQSGKQIMVRQYKVPASSGGGSYDLQVALWFDDNNNYQIDPQGPTGDVLIGTYFVANALTVTGPVSVESSDPALPQVPYLAQNFPNPFNPSTTIRFDLPTDAHATLRVFNMFGQEVARLADGRFDAGIRTVTFDASGLSSGVYVCRMDARSVNGSLNYSATRRLLLLK